MRIIKRDDLRLGAPSSFRPDDALEQIQERIEQANQQLERDRQKATGEVQDVFDRAHQEGFDQGYEKGLQQGLAEQEAAYQAKLVDELTQRTESAVQALSSICQQLGTQSLEWVRTWEPEALQVIAGIASRVARKVVESDDESIGRTIREILALVARAPRITIHMNPADIETLNLLGESWKNAIPKSTAIDIVASEEISKGGCRVDTDHTSIDATLETQIQRLIDEFSGN